jgi:hypothetical protein
VRLEILDSFANFRLVGEISFEASDGDATALSPIPTHRIAWVSRVRGPAVFLCGFDAFIVGP